VSPCTGGFPLTKNEVLQSRWVSTTSGTSAAEEVSWDQIGSPRLDVFPNPGVGQRTITYTLPHAGRAQLGLYDAQGRLIEQLAIKGDAGSHSITWVPSQTRDSRSVSPGGVCFVRLDFDGQILTKELLLIR